MNAMYPNTAVPSTTTTNATTEGRYDWETGNVTAVPSTVRTQLACLNEALIAQKNMIRAIGENLHGNPHKNDAVPKQEPVGPICVLEALEDIADRMHENNRALDEIMHDLGIDC